MALIQQTRKSAGWFTFTKIVQRLPVKIVLAPNQPTARLLRVGLSVEATIETELADVVAASEADFRAKAPLVLG